MSEKAWEECSPVERSTRLKNLNDVHRACLRLGEKAKEAKRTSGATAMLGRGLCRIGQEGALASSVRKADELGQQLAELCARRDELSRLVPEKHHPWYRKPQQGRRKKPSG